MKKPFIILFLIINSIFSLKRQGEIMKIDPLIEKAVKINRFSGTVLISKKIEIIYEKAFGYYNVDKNIKNTAGTLYQIGSTTKEFTAAVILKLLKHL